MNDDLKTNKKLLANLIERTDGITLEVTNLKQHITTSFYKRFVSSAKAVLALIDDAYNACIITSHMLEALIQLIWMLEKDDRIKQYIDYGIVEQLEGLDIFPEKKDDILKIIEKGKIQRLLKKRRMSPQSTERTLLDPNSYHNFWYKPEVNSIRAMRDNLVKNGEHNEINNLYHMYKRFCSYKHCSPYVMIPRYSPQPLSETPDAFLAVAVSFQCLYIACLLVNRYQSFPLDLGDITREYEAVLGVRSKS